MRLIRAFANLKRTQEIFSAQKWFSNPLEVSSVAYVKILDRENKAVLQATVNLQGGVGKGSLYLPVSLSPGVYRLRAYAR